MAWTAPMTAVANAVFTSAQFNTHIRDNLLETAPAKATTANGYFVATGSNTIAQRLAGSSEVGTLESTTSTSYVNLATTGPQVTVTTGTSALVVITAQVFNNTSSDFSIMGVDVSGATTIAPSDTDAAMFQQAAGETLQNSTVSMAKMFTLTAGSNTFTAKYRTVSGGTANFRRRKMVVIPF